jgi:hypothetical protein
MNAIWAETADWLFSLALPTVTPRIATMNSHINMPRAPQIRIVRLPKRSTIQKERGVEQTLTKVVIRPIRKGLLIVPSSWKKVVPK